MFAERSIPQTKRNPASMRCSENVTCSSAAIGYPASRRAASIRARVSSRPSAATDSKIPGDTVVP